MTELQLNVSHLDEYVDRATRGLMSYWSGRVGAAARTGAPWTDRTSNARNGLQNGSGKQGDTYFIVLAHSVPYGVWLEVRWSGRYSVILPTLSMYGPRVMSAFNRILQRYGAVS
jgi:hypothetical protein